MAYGRQCFPAHRLKAIITVLQLNVECLSATMGVWLLLSSTGCKQGSQIVLLKILWFILNVHHVLHVNKEPGGKSITFNICLTGTAPLTPLQSTSLIAHPFFSFLGYLVVVKVAADAVKVTSRYSLSDSFYACVRWHSNDAVVLSICSQTVTKVFVSK